ncbi:MAG: type I-C CRISPR-associated protein Cas7/Csd2 [Pseudomonadota bacterium]
MNSPVLANRYDFVYLFDCKDGNPNGDPDMANTPRFDPETFQGIVSDVCLKRKIRDYVFASKSRNGSPEPGYDIFVLQGHSLESRQRMPYDNLKELQGSAKGKDSERGDVEKAREWMCANFFDVRAFGAVMSTTDFNCGQVRGPAQITFARSIDRVLATEHGITRVAYTKEAKKQSTLGETEMGNKHTIAYGLYRTHGFINPHFAELRGENDGKATGTGFTEADLAVLWDALSNMFDLDRSASRGEMTAQGLWVFRHDSKLGNAPAHKLFELIKVSLRQEQPPRAFGDYAVEAPADGPVPGFPGVTVKRLI